MKRVKRILAVCTISIFISLSFYSCCKRECVGSEIYLSFENYRLVEIDTLIFLGFVRNSGFSVLKDSTQYFIPTTANDTFKTSQGHTIFPDKDLILKIPSLNKQIRFSDFKLEQARCGCGEGKYDITRSFAVDGNKVSGNYYVVPR